MNIVFLQTKKIIIPSLFLYLIESIFYGIKEGLLQLPFVRYEKSGPLYILSHIIYNPSVSWAINTRKKNLDIHFLVKDRRDVWAGSCLNADP